MNPNDTDNDAEPDFFSLQEAERMLPLVRRIVEDIASGFNELEPRADRFTALPPDAAARPEGRALRADVEERIAGLNELAGELAELGCLFKGFPDGLVDWYSYYAGRPVFLCWKLGEPRIEWWHQVDAGFAGRQPILTSQREAFRAEP